MARIMISCPTTGRPVYTHMTSDWSAFETLELSNESLRCPECAAIHNWGKDDAYLEDEGGSC